MSIFTMNTINKSFLWGIVFASITWVISLYLYMQLAASTGSSFAISTQFSSPTGKLEQVIIKKNKVNSDLNLIISNNIGNNFDKHVGAKDYPETKHKVDKKSYVNSDKLIKSLQPVLPTSPAKIDKELNELGMVKTLNDKQYRDEGYKLYAFNALVSKNLDPNRTIPDTRHKLCKRENYLFDLQKTSVVICFYNEHFETLFRSVSSVLRRTPPEFLQQIILVDDSSDIDGLSDRVNEWVTKANNNVLKYLNTGSRQGLIRARMLGASFAQGEVIVFLDSHIEVNEVWLEPLLSQIAFNPKSAAIPIIDIINPDTFAYTPSPLVRGGFNWGLHFKWENLPAGTLEKDEDFIKAIKTPAMAGGLFAINRQYFTNLGEYDPGMDIWGGENLELSFRIMAWGCAPILLLLEEEEEKQEMQNRRRARLHMRLIRDAQNPFDLPEAEFVLTYHLSKEACKYVIDTVGPHMDKVRYCNCNRLPSHLRIFFALNYLSCGSYQSTIGNNVNLSQSIVSRSLKEFVNVLVRRCFNAWVRFPRNNAEREDLKTGFRIRHHMENILGVVHATQIAITAPVSNPQSYMNREGYYSLNVQIIWMCGGELAIIPCSRVGHVFRKRRPYGSPNGEDTMLKNSLRVAHIWLDNYKEYFFKQRPESKNVSYGNVNSRLALREQLKCQNFDWYLKNVYPELVLPTDDEARLKKKWSALEQNKFQPWHLRKRNYVSQYQIRLSNSSLCVQSAKDEKTKGASLILARCLRTKKQMWYETDKSELVLTQLLCMDAGQSNVRLSKCHEMGGTQEWKHKGEDGTPIYNMASGTCLGVKKKEIGTIVTMEFCTEPNLSQWDLVI